MMNDAESGRITAIFCTGHFSWTGPWGRLLLEGVVFGLGIKTKKISCSREISFVDEMSPIRGLFL